MFQYSKIQTETSKVKKLTTTGVGDAEKNIVFILAKIKGKVVRERVRVSEFLKDYDCHNEGVIKKEDFKRGLSLYNFNLTENEVETLMDV